MCRGGDSRISMMARMKVTYELLPQSIRSDPTYSGSAHVFDLRQLSEIASGRDQRGHCSSQRGHTITRQPQLYGRDQMRLRVYQPDPSHVLQALNTL